MTDFQDLKFMFKFDQSNLDVYIGIMCMLYSGLAQTLNVVHVFTSQTEI